ncbi:unnamed protein product [Owenia fusiformis]|uniref:Uncharacterized protein n=1 Tax=Owenia fusiformis TaxID=6347 RepID=A0A8J1T7L6_OWEFU|nr:unnamed protein product [Owenia fusiformis]
MGLSAAVRILAVVTLVTFLHDKNAVGQTDKKIHPRLAELARIAVELKLDLERVTETLENNSPGKKVKEWIGVANSMLMYMLSKSLQFGSTSPKGSPQATAIWKFRGDILKELQLVHKNMKKQKSKADMMKFSTKYKRLCNDLKEWIDEYTASTSKTSTEQPCPTTIPCPTQEPCPTQKPCSTQEPCPACPTQEPCPICSTQEPSPTCPTQEPCPTCPTQEPCPTCPTQEPCPTLATDTPVSSTQTIEMTTPLQDNGGVVVGIGPGINVASGLGTHGWWSIDPGTMGSKVWVIRGYGWNDITILQEYANEVELRKNNPMRSTNNIAGVACDGTGHAIYKGHLYCNRANTNKIVKININTASIAQERDLPDAGIHNKYPYNWSGFSDIDFALDDNDIMYVIYGSVRRNGDMVVSKLDMDSLSIQQTWSTTIKKKSVGNAFVLGGVLYVLNSYNNPTHISYKFDPQTNTQSPLGPSDIPYEGPMTGYLTQLAYMPGTGLLYVWDNGNILKVPIAFNSSGLTTLRQTSEVSTIQTYPTSEVSKYPTTPGCNGGNCDVDIGNAINVTSGFGTHGWWSVDPGTPGSRVWVIRGYGWNDRTTLQEYANEIELRKNNSMRSTTNIAGVACDGTGHAIYKGHLYCNRANTNKIVKININTASIVQERDLPDAGVHNKYAYQWGGFSDIDFALDDNDVMYVIYGSITRNGNMVVSKLDRNSLSILQTWNTTIKKNSVGNSFVLGGVLYVLNSYNNPTYISFKFDTQTNTQSRLGPSDIPYKGPMKGYLTQLAYMPGRGLLYIWDNGNLLQAPIAFNSSGLTTLGQTSEVSTIHTYPTSEVSTKTTPNCDGGNCNVDIGSAINVTSDLGTHGWWSIDPATPVSKVWVIRGYGWNNISILQEYANEAELKKRNPMRSITNIAGVACDGTGHAIYKGHLYCNRAATNKMVKINMDAGSIVQERDLPDAGVHNKYAYQWGGFSDIDFALDDDDVMYVIYGSLGRGGIIAVSKLDKESLSILQTWYTTLRKNGAGNAFMVKGVLYVLNSYSRPTHISYKFDTNTNTGTTLRLTDIPYNGPSNGYLTQLAYMPGWGLLYIWDKGLLQKVPIGISGS